VYELTVSCWSERKQVEVVCLMVFVWSRGNKVMEGGCRGCMEEV
jgi:hypothetical protein